jgi:hypothetical protein
MKEMRNYIVALILTILISTTAFEAVEVKKNNFKVFHIHSYFNNDADLPKWEIGHRWIYNLDIKGNQGNSMNFDLRIRNLEFEVNEILEESYNISLTVPKGDINGMGTLNLDVLSLSGNLINTGLEGYMMINKSNLEIIEINAYIDGYVDKIVDIHFTVDFNLTFYDSLFTQKNFSSLLFPLNADEDWFVPFTYVSVSLELNLAPQTVFIYTFIDSHGMLCEKWDVVDVGDLEHDSLKVLRNYDDESNVIFYSPAAGNIVKISLSDLEFGYGYFISLLEMSLISTTYHVDSYPPNTPSSITGPTNLIAGEEGIYFVSAVDPDDDKIRYIFDWGDGTVSSSNYLPSGEIAYAVHSWNSKGNFQVKAKSRDVYGKESMWSDSINVNVSNNPPEKPQKPQGKSKVNVKNSHTYSTVGIDPDGHEIRYLFDWGDGDTSWTDFFGSGEHAAASHKWSSQDVYELRVKAFDRYGGESHWSDTISVAVPKNVRSYINQITIREFIEFILSNNLSSKPDSLYHI